MSEEKEVLTKVEEKKKQNLVCIKSPFNSYVAALYGWQMAIPEIRSEAIYDMIDTKLYLVDSKLNKNWEIEISKENQIRLVGEDGFYYSITKQGDFMGYDKEKETLPCTLVTDIQMPDLQNPDEGKEYKVDHGDKLCFKNYWGKYFGYTFTRPTLISVPCDETTFTVNQKGVLLKLDYSCVTMTTVGTFVDLFEIVHSPVKGFYHLISTRNGKKIFLGSTPLGEVMCWNDNKFRTTYWQIE